MMNASKNAMRILGHMHLAAAAASLVPLLLAAIWKEYGCLKAFALPLCAFLIIGLILTPRGPKTRRRMSPRDGMKIAAIAYLSICAIGTLPYYMSGAVDSVLSALFESISAVTTTGATTIKDIDALPKSILFWRSFSQWLGGLSVMLLLLKLVPGTYSGSLLTPETTGVGARNTGRGPSRATLRIIGIYGGLTLIQSLLLAAGGAGLLDAVLMSFACCSTGGFSVRSAGTASILTPYMRIVMTAFMLICASRSTTYISLMRGGKPSLKYGAKAAEAKAGYFKLSSELKAYIGFLIFPSLLVSTNLYMQGSYGFEESLSYGSFQTVSFLTSTGTAATDFSSWPPFSAVLLTLISFAGGCSASPAGGLKIIRVVILAKLVKRSFTTKLHPNAVLPVKTDGKALPSSLCNAVVYYTFAYVLLYFVGVFLFTFDSIDLGSCFTASAAMLNNVGTGFGTMGFRGYFGEFSNFSKLAGCILMLAGRLEIYPLVALFSGRLGKERI